MNGLATKFAITDSLLRKWIDHYQKSGIQGLLPQYGRSYSEDFKRNVVRTYYNDGLSLRDCCLQYQIRSLATLSRWVRQYEQFGG
ncbi:helix-turn-helix domain-containing protein, partial [Dyadobacter sp. CY326]|uniref:helix-turn-helix domain-containing protein n=1 Tax=Dyadobacter sp. CY326 TaxID=2907300 RepID=UPI001F39A163